MVDITAAEVFRDFVTDGVPSSGAHNPRKPDIRKLLKQFETIIAAFMSNGGVIYASKAALDADLARPANTMAWVMGDAVAANNGIYRKVGASGAGNWLRAGDLPYSSILASNVGTGTPSAIQATTTIPVSGSALILLQITDDYAGTAATVSFNGAAPLTIKTNSGEDVRNLAGGSVVYGVISGVNFRLANDEAIATLIYEARDAAVDAADKAEDARDIAAGYASDAVSQGNVPIYGTVQGFPALTIPAGLIGVRLNGYSSVGDGGEWPLVYEVANSGPLKAWQRQTNGGSRRWEIAPSIVPNPLMFGASKDLSINSDAAINAAIELAQLRGQRFIDGGGFRYKISSRSAINNKFGIDLLNMALIESVTGGDVQVNTYADRNQRWIGKEYLWGLYNWIKLTSNPVKVFAYGDSTMQAPSGWDFGAGTTPFEAFFQSMWPRLAKQIGLKQPLQVTNRGVGGQTVAGMDFTADLASGMQLMIIKYGINDRTVTGDRDSALRTFADNLFGKLEAVRSAPGGEITALSIVLVGPSSTYDPATDRDSSWYEGVRGIYEAAARKFRCAYFDTYGYMQDSEWAVGQWLDAAGLHPEGVGSWWIFGHLFNLVFPERELEYWRRNHITNTSGSFDVPESWWNLNTEYFNYGPSLKFARTAEGFPATGGLLTLHQADKAGAQLLFPTDTRGVVHFRTYNPESGVASFGQWTGEVKGISLTAPWQEFDPANYGNSYCVRTVDGMVHGRLCIRGGSNLNNGAEIGTLPAGLRPSSIEQFLSFNLAGAIGRIDITPAGKIRVVGGVTSEMLNASFSFRAA